MDTSTLITQLCSVLVGSIGVVITYFLKRWFPDDRNRRPRPPDNRNDENGQQ